MRFDYCEDGEVYFIKVTEYFVKQPDPYCTDSDWDFYGYTDFEYVVFDEDDNILDVYLNDDLVLKRYLEETNEQ